MNNFCEYMDTDCTKCKHAEWDCEEYFGGGKQYFVCGCNRDADLDADECEEYEEYEEEEE